MPGDEEFDEHDASATHAVAVDGGDRVVGTGRLYRNDAGEAQIGRMAVALSRRGQGIGDAILKWLEGLAVEQGVTEVIVHAQAYLRAFYGRRGYRADGDPFDEAGIEHVRMTKTLAVAAPLLQSNPTCRIEPGDSF